MHSSTTTTIQHNSYRQNKKKPKRTSFAFFHKNEGIRKNKSAFELNTKKTKKIGRSITVFFQNASKLLQNIFPPKDSHTNVPVLFSLTNDKSLLTLSDIQKHKNVIDKLKKFLITLEELFWSNIITERWNFSIYF